VVKLSHHLGCRSLDQLSPPYQAILSILGISI
jgi:hypothetical protein